MKLQILFISLLHIISTNYSLCQILTNKKIEKIKTEAITIVESNYKNTEIMVDKVFSFAELGFQEIETSKYLTDILSKNNFTIEKVHVVTGDDPEDWDETDFGLPIKVWSDRESAAAYIRTTVSKIKL